MRDIDVVATVLLRLVEILIGGIIVALLFFFLSSKTPYSMWEFWTIDGFWAGVVAAWPLYVWAVVIHILMNFFRFNGYTATPGETLFWGVAVSIWAGVTEEIVFRWLMYFGSIWSIQLFAWILGGFAGVDILQWMHIHVFLPIADFMTFGYLHDRLHHPEVWAAGAAMLYSNGKFRDGHAYQGPFGMVHAWFGGMFFFWLMFNYGLPAAIVAHALFDFLCFATIAVDVAIEQRVYRARHMRRMRW